MVSKTCRRHVSALAKSTTASAAHSIRRLVVFSGISDEWRNDRVVDSFHSDNDVHQLGIVVVNMFDQFKLCIGGSCNENCTGVCNGFSGCVKKDVIL